MQKRWLVPFVALIVIAGFGALVFVPGTPTAVQKQWLGAVGAMLVIGIGLLLLWLASKSDLLRDADPTDFGVPSPGKAPLRRPFSLAQTQMAWWFYLVFAAYLYVFITTGNYKSLTSQALMLMGIGTGTALGAAAIEQTKTDPKQQRLQALLAKVKDNTATDAEKQESAVLAQVLASHGFFDDILSDVDGICLHRFQTVVWTVVMGGIFVSEVMSSGEMPEFDGNTLALLGISSGTYLGFKIPETPA